MTKGNLKSIIACFYIVCFANLQVTLKQFFETDYSDITNTKIFPFSYLFNEGINDALYFIAPLTMLLLVIILPLLHFQSIRWLWAILTYLIFGTKFSHIIGHSNHIYVWLAVFFATIPGNLNQYSSKDVPIKVILRLAQIQVLAIYALSGFKKVYALFDSLFNKNLATGSEYAKYSMAQEYISSNVFNPIGDYLVEHQAISFFLYYLVVLLQFGSVFVIFFPRLYFSWGLLLALFHIGTLIMASVFFYWLLPPILLLLCWADLGSYSLKETYRDIRTNLARA